MIHDFWRREAFKPAVSVFPEGLCHTTRLVLLKRPLEIAGPEGVESPAPVIKAGAGVMEQGASTPCFRLLQNDVDQATRHNDDLFRSDLYKPRDRFILERTGLYLGPVGLGRHHNFSA